MEVEAHCLIGGVWLIYGSIIDGPWPNNVPICNSSCLIEMPVFPKI